MHAERLGAAGFAFCSTAKGLGVRVGPGASALPVARASTRGPCRAERADPFRGARGFALAYGDARRAQTQGAGVRSARDERPAPAPLGNNADFASSVEDQGVAGEAVRRAAQIAFVRVMVLGVGRRFPLARVVSRRLLSRARYSERPHRGLLHPDAGTRRDVQRRLYLGLLARGVVKPKPLAL